MSIEEILRQIGTNMLWMYATLGLGALISVVVANLVVALEERDKSKKSHVGRRPSDV